MTDNITQAAANKAAEECGLPERISQLIFDNTSLGWDKASNLATAVLVFVEADRASRQVANKAEVEPVAYMYEWIGTQHELNKGRIIARMPDELGGNIDLHPESWKRIGSLYATPPATTGASTAPVETFIELRNRVAALESARIAYASEFPLTEDGEPDVGNIHANIRALKGSVGASTVLTDERIEQDFLKHWDSVVHEYGFNREVNTAYNAARAAWFAREVAAQAGQVASVPSAVAVPEGWTITKESNVITVEHPAVGKSTLASLALETAAQTVLYHLADQLLAPSPAKESK